MAGTPVFYLIDDAGGKFILDGNYVKVAGELDYETTAAYSITIGVTGVTPAVPNRSFTISILNTEEGAINLIGTDIAETASVGDVVGIFNVSLATGTPVYSLVDSSGGKFSIDGDELKVAAALDYETSVYHDIIVSVSGLTPPLQNATFRINVENISPAISAYYPLDGALNFPYDGDIVATFTTPVTLNTGTITLSRAADSAVIDSWDVETDEGSGPGSVEVVSSTQLTMHLSNSLDVDTDYNVTWEEGVVQDAGGELVSAISSSTAWNFRAVAPPGYDIFLTTGDSNLMTGAGLDVAIDVVDADVKQLGYTSPNTNLPIAAIEPLDYASQGMGLTDGYIGHDQHFAVDYYKRLGHLKSPRQVLLVVDGIGGSSVTTGWGATGGTVGNPTSTGSELTLATTRLATGLALTGTNQVMGVLDHEVVNNYLAYGISTGGALPSGYRVNKYREIQYLRNLVGPTVPIVVCRAAKTCINADLGAPYGTNGVMYDRILQSIPKHFPYTAIADSQVPTELLASGDGVHFTAPEQRILAERYYTAWLAAQSNSGRVVLWDADCLRMVDGYLNGVVVSNGGLDATIEGADGWKSVRATGPLRSGKAYCEIKITVAALTAYVGLGNGDMSLNAQTGSTGKSAGIWGATDSAFLGWTRVYAGTGTAWGLNDVAMLAVDMATGKAWIGKNGTWFSGNPAAGTGEWISGIVDPVHVMVSQYSGTAVVRLQAKASSFTHTPPTGFSAWQEDVPTPSALSYFPADNSINVINALGKIYARFNCALTFGVSGTITLKKTSDNSTVQTWNVATDQGYTAGKVGIINEYLLVMYLSASLGQGMQYYVVYDAGVVKNIENETNAAQASTTAWSFTSIDVPTPVPVTYSPADNATGVSVHTPYLITFNTPIVAGTGTISLKKTSDNTTVKSWNIVTDAGSLAGQCKIEGSNLHLYPAVARAANTEHYIVWDAGVVTNVALEPVAALSVTTTWSFTTEATASLLLDTFTYGGVWSVRKLVTAYAGNCVRIRRSSDNAEQNFGFVSSLLDTAGIATFIGGGTGYLVTWYDQGGNSINTTLATAAQQALYVAAGPGSKPTFRFPGTGFYRISSIPRTSFMNADEVTFFQAFKEDSTLGSNTPIRYFHTINTEDLNIVTTYTDSLGMVFGNNTTGNTSKIMPTSWNDLWHVTEMYRLPPASSNEQGIYVDGVLHKKEFDKVGSFPTTTGTDFTSHTWMGDNSEMFTIKTGLGYDDRTIIRHNMMTAFAIALPLVLDGHIMGAAYGLRRLRTNYTGNCVRIRRSSDSTEQNFGFVNNIVDTAGIATFVGAGSGFIVTWYDQSGSTLDITNATPANQPLFVASGIGSKPTLRFDGTNDSLARASVAFTSLAGSASVNTTVLVMKQDGTQTNNVAYYWNGTNYFYGKATMANNLDFVNGVVGPSNGGTFVAQPTGWDDTPHILEATRQGTSAKNLYIDGVGQDGTNAAGAVASGTATLSIGTDGTNFLKGDLPELFFIKAFVDTIPRGVIRTNLASYYGITVL